MSSSGFLFRMGQQRPQAPTDQGVTEAPQQAVVSKTIKTAHLVHLLLGQVRHEAFVHVLADLHGMRLLATVFLILGLE